jgi:GDPmannose 4,6-dehydratase
MNKIALITGICGQDGSYLTEFLLEKGYIVHGIIRRASQINTKRLDSIYQDPHNLKSRLFLHYGDMSDTSSIENIINKVKPDEVYNLAAMSHVRVSFDIPEYTSDIDGTGTLRILECIKNLEKNLNKKIKFYQAGTSELYGGIYNEKQNEDTPFNPRSPYAVAKLYSYWITKNYRDAYNLFAVNGILFNHTSPRRGETFVEKKIIKGAVKISKKLQDCLYLGNIYSYRDFGHAKDFVKAMWLMLQNDCPIDYVISSGEKYMIKDIINLVFLKLNIPIRWLGTGVDEIAIVDDNCSILEPGKIIIKIDPKYFRPTEVESLVGDSTKAIKELKWVPEYNFEDIINEMIDYELKNIN